MSKYYHLSGGYSDKLNLILGYMKLGYQIAMIIFATISLIMAVLAYSKLMAHQNAMEDFVDNWQTPPLVDISVSTTSCPGGYENLVSRNWPGTVSGCDCRYSSKYYFRIYTGYCDQNQTEANCRDIYPRSSIPMTRLYQYNICGKREGDPFKTAIRPNGASGCPTNTRLCITDGDVNNKLCIRKEYGCPITDLQVVDQNSVVPVGYAYKYIGGGFKVIYSSLYNSLPSIRYRLTEGQVCADHSQYTKTSGRNLYLLLNTASYGSCSSQIADKYYYDPRYYKVGGILEKTLFDDNGVNSVIATLPDYPPNQNYDWNLYQNPYYKWDLNCENQKYDRVTMVEYMNDAMVIGEKQLSLMLICIINSIICSVIVAGINIYFAIKNLGDPDFGKENRVPLFLFYLASQGISWIFLILKLVFYIQCIRVINDYGSAITEINASKCSDNMSNDFMQTYGDTLTKSQGNNKTGLVFNIISMVTSFLFITINLLVFAVKMIRG